MSHTSAEYEHLDDLLRAWGAWHEKHFADAVLPREAAFCAMMSDQPAGSRILCADMSPRVYEVNLAVQMLRVRYRRALFVWYAMQLKPEGGYWTVAEKAQFFNCTPNALRKRVARGKIVALRKFYQVREAKALQKRQLCDKSMQACKTASAS
jgi:hypothetical protein